MKIQSIKTLGLLVVILLAIPFSIFAQQGWDNYKPSETFTKALRELIDSKQYVAKDSFNVITTANTIDSSDIGTITLSTFAPFRKARTIWSAVIRSSNVLSIPTPDGYNKAKTVYPFVGIEEWVFTNNDEATTCINMLRNQASFGSYRLNLHLPPREFVQQGNRIFYFYTFPVDFYPRLTAVRDVFMKYMTNPDIVK